MTSYPSVITSTIITLGYNVIGRTKCNWLVCVNRHCQEFLGFRRVYTQVVWHCICGREKKRKCRRVWTVTVACTFTTELWWVIHILMSTSLETKPQKMLGAWTCENETKIVIDAREYCTLCWGRPSVKFQSDWGKIFGDGNWYEPKQFARLFLNDTFGKQQSRVALSTSDEEFRKNANFGEV